eukprot:1728229-Rhodomonas_salina.2
MGLGSTKYNIALVPGIGYQAQLWQYRGAHRTRVHCEIKCKKPHFQYNSYQECGFLSLISGCRPIAYLSAFPPLTTRISRIPCANPSSKTW